MRNRWHWKKRTCQTIWLKFQNEYRTILWFTYNSTLEDMIITDQFLLIHGLENEKQDLTTLRHGKLIIIKS